MGSLSILQGIFLTQESNQALLHYRWIVYQLSYQGSPWFCSVHFSRSIVSDSLQPHGLQPARLLYSWDSPGKNTGVGYHSLLQGIFLTQGSSSGFLHCRQILYHLTTRQKLVYMYIFKLEFSPDICPSVGLQDHTVIILLVF